MLLTTICGAGFGVLLTFLVGQVIGAVPEIVSSGSADAAQPVGATADVTTLTEFGLLLGALLLVFLAETVLPALRTVAEWGTARSIEPDVALR